MHAVERLPVDHVLGVYVDEEVQQRAHDVERHVSLGVLLGVREEALELTRQCVHTRTHTRTHTDTHTRTHKHTDTDTHTDTHTCVCDVERVWVKSACVPLCTCVGWANARRCTFVAGKPNGGLSPRSKGRERAQHRPENMTDSCGTHVVTSGTAHCTTPMWHPCGGQWYCTPYRTHVAPCGTHVVASGTLHCTAPMRHPCGSQQSHALHRTLRPAAF